MFWCARPHIISASIRALHELWFMADSTTERTHQLFERSRVEQRTNGSRSEEQARLCCIQHFGNSLCRFIIFHNMRRSAQKDVLGTRRLQTIEPVTLWYIERSLSFYTEFGKSRKPLFVPHRSQGMTQACNKSDDNSLLKRQCSSKWACRRFRRLKLLGKHNRRAVWNDR